VAYAQFVGEGGVERRLPARPIALCWVAVEEQEVAPVELRVAG